MNSEKYIGLDVHQATISVAVLDYSGRLVMECILQTKAGTILEFCAGLRGTLSVLRFLGKADDAGRAPCHLEAHELSAGLELCPTQNPCPVILVILSAMAIFRQLIFRKLANLLTFIDLPFS